MVTLKSFSSTNLKIYLVIIGGERFPMNFSNNDHLLFSSITKLVLFKDPVVIWVKTSHATKINV